MRLPYFHGLDEYNRNELFYDQIALHLVQLTLLTFGKIALQNRVVQISQTKFMAAVCDIVLLKSDSTSITFWKLAKVEELLVS